MELQNETSLIESILFLENEPVDIQTLSKLSGLSKDVVRAALARLFELFANEEHGIEIIEIGEGFLFSPKESLWQALKGKYGKKNEKQLSKAAMETLSIIAYSQPITRSEIENIRGVSSDNMIRLLMHKNLIREVGKKDVPGKPIQLGTTKEFLKVFRLKSIAELPKLDEVEQERFELNG